MKCNGKENEWQRLVVFRDLKRVDGGRSKISGRVWHILSARPGAYLFEEQAQMSRCERRHHSGRDGGWRSVRARRTRDSLFPDGERALTVELKATNHLGLGVVLSFFSPSLLEAL